MLIPLLQSSAEKFSADTLVTKGSQLVETIRTTPANELLQGTASAAARFGLKVLLALLLYIVGAWLIRKTKKLISKGFAKKQTDSTLSSFIQSTVTALLWIVLILAMVGTLGINITSIAALLAAGGMAVGMAMSGTVQNFAGGLMLLAFKPFKVGDYVEAQGFFGWISEITIVHTKLITTDNREITIPNGALSNGNIDNYSSRDPRRLSLKVHVPYGTDIEEVRTILVDLAKQHEKVLNSSVPGAGDPYVVVGALNDSNVELLLRVWMTGADFMTVLFWLNEHIYQELSKHGIGFPFPQMDVHMKQDLKS